jgi:uncharacterized protein
MVDIVIFGGTGYAGGHIAAEAARRGHVVTAYARNVPQAPRQGIGYRQGSAYDAGVVADAAERADVLVVALPHHPADGPELIEALPGLVSAATAHHTRLGFVGGAGSSLVAPDGPRVVDGPEFVAEWKPEALAAAALLEALRASDDALDWFVVSPPALFGSYAPGEATGAYRTGGDVLVTHDDGSSEISGADYALAFVDEIEQSTSHRARVTVGH